MLLTKLRTLALAEAFRKFNPNIFINPNTKKVPVPGPKKPS